MFDHPVLFPCDPVLSKEQAQERLQHVSPLIAECILDSFEQLKNVALAGRTLPSALDYMATRQKLMNSIVVECIRPVFAGGDQGGRIHEEKGFLELRVGDDIDVRFKHLDKDGKSANANTVAQKLYRNNLPRGGDGDRLQVMRLTIGWRWDIAATRITDILAVFEKGEAPAWSFSLLDGQRPDTIVLPESTEIIPTVRYKSSSRKDKKSNKGA